MNRTQLAMLSSVFVASSAALAASGSTAETANTDVPRTAVTAHSPSHANDASKLPLALVRAAEVDDLDQAAALVKKHVSPDGEQGDGTTALHWAAYNDDLALAKLLIGAGAKPDAHTRLRQLTPLHMAAETGDAALIDALLKAGAKVDALNESGTTPLMIASASGSTDAVRTLLAHGADVNARATIDEAGIGGQTPIFHAVTQFNDWGLEVARVLIERGADLTVRVKLPGHYERAEEVVECTPLGYAIRFPGGASKTVSMLRELGAGE